MKSKIMFVLFNAIISFGQTIAGNLEDTTQYIFETKNLQIQQLSEHTFCHVSFLQTTDFGNVPCNGMVVIDNGEALVFDTPANKVASIELINWIENELKCKIKGVVATHFHNDCLAGLDEFHERNIPSYGSFKTIELAKNDKVTPPQNGFKKSFVLEVGTKIVDNEFLGEGHTKDNIVCYFFSEKVLFGGCLIKELEAGKGYLGDANLKSWSKTVSKVKKKFSNAEIIIPGHGKVGDQSLLDYTIQLFLNE